LNRSFRSHYGDNIDAGSLRLCRPPTCVRESPRDVSAADPCARGSPDLSAADRALEDPRICRPPTRALEDPRIRRPPIVRSDPRICRVSTTLHAKTYGSVCKSCGGPSSYRFAPPCAQFLDPCVPGPPPTRKLQSCSQRCARLASPAAFAVRVVIVIAFSAGGSSWGGSGTGAATVDGPSVI
jgi:hypothetical protein